jgi:hypothetical protein
MNATEARRKTRDEIMQMNSVNDAFLAVAISR